MPTKVCVDLNFSILQKKIISKFSKNLPIYSLLFVYVCKTHTRFFDITEKKKR